jgi:hypothetical protein
MFATLTSKGQITLPKEIRVAGVNYLGRPATTILAGWKRGMISL